MAWLRSDLLALREERPTTTMFYERASAPLSAAGAAAAAKLSRVAEALLPRGATSLFGAWSAADTDLAFMLHRLILNRHPVPDGVQRFAEAQWQRPSVRKWVEHERPAYRPY
jgi:glutathione S-transferase